MPPSDSPKLLTIGEAAARVGVSVDTLRRYATDGKVAYLRTPGGQRRFRPDDIDQLMQPAGGDAA